MPEGQPGWRILSRETARAVGLLAAIGLGLALLWQLLDPGGRPLFGARLVLVALGLFVVVGGLGSTPLLGVVDAPPSYLTGDADAHRTRMMRAEVERANVERPVPVYAFLAALPLLLLGFLLAALP